MDLSKLTTSDKLILGGGIVYLIAMFLPWWGIDTDFGDFANNGWDYFLGGWVPLIIIAIMVGHVGGHEVLPRHQDPRPARSVGPGLPDRRRRRGRDRRGAAPRPVR